MALRKICGMGCSGREEIVEVLDEFDDALDRLCELTFDVLTTRNGCGRWSAWNGWRAGCAHPSMR